MVHSPVGFDFVGLGDSGRDFEWEVNECLLAANHRVSLGESLLALLWFVPHFCSIGKW